MRLLVVEDDEHLGASVTAAMRMEGYTVDWVRTASDATSYATVSDYQLVILDWNLPDLSGPDWLAAQRRKGFGVPVLFLSARQELGDKVSGLDAGADDYLTKPFDLDELFARCRALVRRNFDAPSPCLKAGALTLDPALKTATLNGEPLDLSRAEFTLLHSLAAQPDVYLSLAQLESRLYSWNASVTPNAIEALVSRLRKKIGRDRIKTKRGFGYALDSAG